MNSWMVSLITMSLLAGVNTIIVLLARAILRKGPRKMICILWSIVFLRMLLPVGISSRWSVYNAVDRIQSAQLMESNRTETTDDHKIEAETPALNVVLPELVIETSAANKTDTFMRSMGYIWVGGFLVMLMYLTVSIYKLRRITMKSTPLAKHVRKMGTDQYSFVFGSNVYIAEGMTQDETYFVLRHELAHRARGDFYWKLAGYVLLCFHWFNPILWAAYIVFCHDLEVACDERVIAKMDDSERADYAQVLLNSSRQKNNPANFSMAFAGMSVKQRIKHILTHKESSVVGIAISAAMIFILSGCLMTNPVAVKNKEHYLLSIPGLSYGMTEEEIIGVLGEPSSRKVNDGMAILTYTENIDSCFIHDDTEYGVLLYMDGDDPKESRLMNLNINVISTWKDVEADMLEYYGPYTKNEYNYSTTVGFGREDAVPWISYYGYEELLGEEKVTITLTTFGAEETVPEKYMVIVGISLMDQLYQY